MSVSRFDPNSPQPVPYRPVDGLRLTEGRSTEEGTDYFLKTPAGEFRNCLKTRETTPLEPDANDYKIYARGVGMISDGGLLISKHANIGAGGH